METTIEGLGCRVAGKIEGFRGLEHGCMNSGCRVEGFEEEGLEVSKMR